MNLKKEYVYFAIGGLLVLALGIFIGLNLNRKEKVYKEDPKVTIINNTKNSENKKDTISEDTLENVTNKKSNEVNSDNTSTTTTNKKVTSSTNKNNNTINSNVSKNNTSSNNSNNIQSSTQSEVTNNILQDNSYSQNDLVVINSLDETLTNINKANVNDKNFKTSAKATFVSIVDFLFYDGTIKGVTFKELTEAGKQKVLELASKIDTAIEKKIPGYKDTIANGCSKAFNAASGLIKKGASNVNNFLMNNLDSEDYNSLIDAKDELVLYSKNALNFIKGAGSSLISSTKDKLSNWYQNWKNQ